MHLPNAAPAEVFNQLLSLPKEYVGTLFAKVKAPGWFGKTSWHKVPEWGTVCSGRPPSLGAVERMMRDDLPRRGRGYTYLAWRAEPDHPELCKASPLCGEIANPTPFDPDAWRKRDDGTSEA
jgi:hypothetical protein